jgi:hypothetical protein
MFTPRHVAGLIRRLPRNASVCVQVELGRTNGRITGSLLPVPRIVALRAIRRLYGTGAKVAVSDFCGDLVLGM